MKQMEVDDQNVHAVIIEATCRITEIIIVWLGEEDEDKRTVHFHIDRLLYNSCG